MLKWHDNSGNMLSVILRYILKPIFLHVHCIDFNGSIIKASHCMAVQRFANFLLVLFCVPRVLWRMKEKKQPNEQFRKPLLLHREALKIFMWHILHSTTVILEQWLGLDRGYEHDTATVCVYHVLDIFAEFLFLLFSSFYIFFMLEHFLMSLLFSLQMSTSYASENWRKSFSQFKKENYRAKCCSSPQAMHGGVPDTGVSHLLRSN